MRTRLLLAWWIGALTLMLQAWAPAQAQTLDRPESPAQVEPDTIVVTAQRPIGAAIGNPEPERQLHPDDIAAYGADSLRDLVGALSLQARGSSASGGPVVVLLNGRRITTFSEIGDIPPEAILRVDFLSEEVARRYGYRIGSKVLNVVVRPSYAAHVAELAYSQATGGGRASPEGSFTIARNGSGLRWNLTLAAVHNEALLESERRIVGGFGDSRSLLPQLDRFTVNGTVARDRPTGVSYSANARGEIRETVDIVGPALATSGATRPLRRERQDRSVRVGGSARGESAGWQWTLAADAQYLTNQTRGERSGAPAYLAEAERFEFSIDGLAHRALAQLPSGEAGLSLRVAFSESRLRSISSLSPGPEVVFDRSRVTLSAGLDLPLSSREQGRRGVGELTLGLSAEAYIDDFERTMVRLDSNVNWWPVRPLTIGLSYSREQEGASLEDLGNPAVTLENVPVFDFTRGETAIVRLRTGGNPALQPTSRESFQAGVTWRPIRGLNISATYTRARSVDVAGPFPAITREVEQAFPDRFVRDGALRLIEVDQSPINFSREARDQFRWGFNWDMPVDRQGRVGTDPPASAREAAAAQDQSGRLNVSVFHTLRIRDDLLVREDLPRLDFLAGSVAGIGGGRARHAIEAQASVGAGGLGARINGSIEGPSRATALSGELLSFSPVARFDFRIFADLGQLMPRKRWATGTRVSLQFGNVFDSRVRVRTARGSVPEGLQSAYLDPLGRTVRLSVRRVF